MPIGPPNSWLTCFSALLSLWLLRRLGCRGESGIGCERRGIGCFASAFWSVKPVVWKSNGRTSKRWIGLGSRWISCAGSHGSSWSDPSTAGRCAHLGAGSITTSQGFLRVSRSWKPTFMMTHQMLTRDWWIGFWIPLDSESAWPASGCIFTPCRGSGPPGGKDTKHFTPTPTVIGNGD